jgi:hypothetical protein
MPLMQFTFFNLGSKFSIQKAMKGSVLDVINGVLIVAAIICAIFTFPRGRNTTQTKKILFFLSSIIVVVLPLVKDTIKDAIDDKNSLDGQMEHPSHSIYEGKPHSSPSPPEYPYSIKIGGITCLYKESAIENGVNIETCIRGSKTLLLPLKLKVIDEKIYISAKIIDLDGKIVCEVVDNEWSLWNKDYRRNHSDEAFEVVDPYGNVALSIELIDKKNVEVRGLFIEDENNLMVAQKDDLVSEKFYQKSTRTRAEYAASVKKLQSQIPRKFVYTGKDYIGKRVPNLDI